jgi:hypothetical protein
MSFDNESMTGAIFPWRVNDLSLTIHFNSLLILILELGESTAQQVHDLIFEEARLYTDHAVTVQATQAGPI